MKFQEGALLSLLLACKICLSACDPCLYASVILLILIAALVLMFEIHLKSIARHMLACPHMNWKTLAHVSCAFTFQTHLNVLWLHVHVILESSFSYMVTWLCIVLGLLGGCMPTWSWKLLSPSTCVTLEIPILSHLCALALPYASSICGKMHGTDCGNISYLSSSIAVCGPAAIDRGIRGSCMWNSIVLGQGSIVYLEKQWHYICSLEDD